jgi:exosome complex RNA-binding protein Csl4
MAALTAGNSSPGVPVFAAGQKVVPGDALGGLGPAGSMVVGSGCYVSESGVVRSRIVGVTNVGVDPGDGGKRTCNVVPFEGDNKKDVIVPKTGDYVTARVKRIHRMYAGVDILMVGTSVLTTPCDGVIRKFDVREAAIDEVEIEASYQPGDLVLAEVISLGDRRRYLLSSAKPYLGVIKASSADGNPLERVSFSEMRNQVTGEIEKRKVARPAEAEAAP